MRKGTKSLLRGAVCLLCVLVMTVMLTAALAAERYPYTTTTTDKVNLRRSASSSAVVLVRVEKGAEVTVTGKSGSYYRVTYGRYTGYILAEYLVPYEQTAAAQATPEVVSGYPYETTTNDSVNLRKSNSQVSEKLMSIPAGATVTVIGETGKYAHLVYKGTEGYARKEYVNMKTVAKATPTPAPTITPAPAASYQSYVTLSQGSAGDAVIALQSALAELGYMNEGQIDGQFGAATANAVKAFQRKNGYPETGIADANLQAFLYSGAPLSSSGAKTRVKTLAPIDGVTIYAGSKGRLVGTMQSRLRELGYYSGSNTMVHDAATVSALKQFQRANGLTADGVAGPQTQAVLFSANAIANGTTPVPTPAPTATPAPTFRIPSGTVERGSSGEDARLVQQRLKELGYYRGTVDGKFGSASVAALKAFQRRHGLTDDGKAGQATYAVLFSNQALPVNVTATPVVLATFPPAETVAPTPAPAASAEITRDNVVTIRLGVTGDAVTRLQQRLTALGYYSATVDGTCKADDVAAIRAFQRANGLKVDGVAGYDTQVKLYSESAILYNGSVAAGNVGEVTTLRLGMTGSEVRQLQERLIALGYLKGTADGVYGSDTANAVIAFQRNNGLKKDGVAGPQTLQKIYSAAAVKAVSATPTPAPTQAAAPAAATASASGVLRKGDKSAAVKNLQQRLIELGYLTGKADGVFGTKTYEAVKAFQRSNRLTVDGIAGTRTIQAMESSTAITANGTVAATPTPTPVPRPSANVRPSASQVQYANWYTSVKSKVKKFQYATVYDFSTGISWQVHMFSFGAHADAEPLTASDTAKMVQAFGGNTWNPKAVWVVLGDGTVLMASTHSMPHEVQHITNNNFAGHLCIHFPRTQAQVTAIGPYATSHQAAIDAGWKVTQSMK